MSSRKTVGLIRRSVMLVELCLVFWRTFFKKLFDFFFHQQCTEAEYANLDLDVQKSADQFESTSTSMLVRCWMQHRLLPFIPVVPYVPLLPPARRLARVWFLALTLHPIILSKLPQPLTRKMKLQSKGCNPFARLQYLWNVTRPKKGLLYHNLN